MVREKPLDTNGLCAQGLKIDKRYTNSQIFISVVFITKK